MAYDSKTAAKNKANADLRPDGKGGMVHKSKVKKSKREIARERLKRRQRLNAQRG